MRKILTYFSILFLLASCGFISSALHDDEVVAKVGKSTLYLSELEAYIPNGLSPEDSTKMAARYIDTWATEQLYMKVAREQLSEEEMDVSSELENYRRSLIKYRYEQRYINDRLDTLVTDSQIEDYYENHKKDFVLTQPVMKVRFADIMKDSRYKDEMLKGMLVDSLTSAHALRWFDKSDSWIEAAELAREFGMDYRAMLDLLKNDFIKYEPKDRGDMLVAYVLDIVYSGYAPLDYCSGHIRDKIISSRKHELGMNLERDLLEDARERKTLVIYR